MQIQMLGPLEVRTADGVEVGVPGARLRGLLSVLALTPGRSVPKAVITDWIWGEELPSDPENALHRLVSRLRKVLPDGLVEKQPDGYRLMVAPNAVDTVRFERLVEQARDEADSRRAQLLRGALNLWRGSAMQDVGLADSATFDAAAHRLDALRLATLEERFDAEVRLGRGVELIAELTDVVAAHPLRERFVAALMRSLVAAGRDTEALGVYHHAKELLADAVGVDPSPALSSLYVALLRGELAPRVAQSKTNLRAELTSFIGKDADVAAVRDLLAAHRLVTVTGPGGAGKTRLATETVRTLFADQADGAWLVELATIGADGDVAQATLSALGLRDALLSAAPGTEPVDGAIAAIRERQLVLVLDNCEHVIAAAAKFADHILRECPNLRIVATSRESLGITGEARWLVEPLALPAQGAGLGTIESSSAVQLLRDRASAVRGDLAVDTETSTTMARICRVLDGMPLAIELAAASLRTLSLGQLADRLTDRFRVLTNGSRTALPRHQTLHAVVDWSWELLTDVERIVLRRVSMFPGGASLEAAEQVCSGDGVDPAHVFDILSSLTDKSLLTTGRDRAPRYRMLGTIAEYAAHRLVEAAETDTVRHAHLRYFTDLAETAEPHLRRAEQVAWLTTLDSEHDNIVAAMRGALAAGEAHAAMRLAAAAGWYWWLSGRRTEGKELLTAATKVPGAVPDDVRALVYVHVMTFLTAGRGDQHQAAEWILQAHQLSQHSRDRHPLLGLISPVERMVQAPHEVLSAFEPLLDDNDSWVRAMARLHLGKMRIILGQETQEAQAHLRIALTEFRALGERFGISFALTELADLIATRGEFTSACEHYDQAIAVVGEVGAGEDIIRMRARQAQLYWLLGDAESSAAALAEAARRAEQVVWPDALAELALARAELARWGGDQQEANRQLGAATNLLGEDAQGANIEAVVHNMLGYLSDDIGVARGHHAAAYRAASEVWEAPLIAQVLVGVADLALRCDENEQAARLLAASVEVRGLRDDSHPDTARIERLVRRQLGSARFAEASREGRQANWSELVTETLASGGELLVPKA